MSEGTVIQGTNCSHGLKFISQLFLIYLNYDKLGGYYINAVQ